MKSLVAAAVVLGSLVTPASAAPNAARYEGGCSFSTNSQHLVTGDAMVGYLAVKTVTTDTYLPPMPVLATVECTIEVNGVVQNSTNRLTVSGYGTQNGAQYTTLTAADNDFVRLCISVHYVGVPGAVDTVHECEFGTTLQLPPQWVIDDVDLVFDVVNQASATGDPVVCPLLAAHAGTYGPFTVTAQGDVDWTDPLSLDGGPYYDCPPYVNGPPERGAGATYCPYGHVTGTAAYSPALAVTPRTVAETFDLTLSGCASSAEPAGDYALHLDGTAVDACVTAGAYPAPGTGGGTLTGSGPNGAVDGTYGLTKHGTRYLVRGRFTSGGREYLTDLWLDQQALCTPDPLHLDTGLVASSALTGDGAVVTAVTSPG